MPPIDEQPLRSFDEPELEREPPFMVKIGFLLLCISLGAMVGAAIMLGLGHLWDFDLAAMLYEESTYDTASGRNKIRGTLLVNHLTTFVIPPLIFCWFFYRSNWGEYLKLKVGPDSINILVGSLFMFAVMPVAQLAMWLNKKIPLPEWMHMMEEQNSALVANMLQADSTYELFFNLLVVAVLPAIGEEILFRGVIQEQIERKIKNGVVAVWIAAAIFSAVHMQFEGFLARLVLGAALGYLFYWAKNLWVPIIAHFLNNGLQVVAAHFFMEDLEGLQEQASDQSPVAAGIIGCIIVYFLGKYLWNYNKNRLYP